MSDQNAALFDKLDGFYVTKSEHDWLERRFSNMTEKEKILFQGAMELEKPQEIGHVMRIASQLDCYDLRRNRRGGGVFPVGGAAGAAQRKTLTNTRWGYIMRP